MSSLGFSAGVTVNEFSSDVDLTGNSDTAVPTEKAVKTYVDAAVLEGAGAANVYNTVTSDDGTATATWV